LGRRFRKFIAQSNPGLLDEETQEGDPSTMIAQLQGQLAQATQQSQTAQQALKQVTEELVKAIDTREDKEREINAKIQMNIFDNKTKIQLERMKAGQADDAESAAEIDDLDKELEQLETSLGITGPEKGLETSEAGLPAPNPGPGLAPAQGGEPT